MDSIKMACAALALGLLGACASPQDKAANAQADAAKAQERVANERLELVNKYQKCVKDAGDDQQKAAACDSYLKAADALK